MIVDLRKYPLEFTASSTLTFGTMPPTVSTLIWSLLKVFLIIIIVYSRDSSSNNHMNRYSKYKGDEHYAVILTPR